MNENQQEWLGSTTTNRLGVAASEFATVSVAISLVLARLMHEVELITSS